jgi:hypothetical protein
MRDGWVGGVVGKEQEEGRRCVCVTALDVTEKYQPVEHLELAQSLYCKWHMFFAQVVVADLYTHDTRIP